jgi:hypothetical protein
MPTCPVCASTNVDTITEVGGTTFYHCLDCDETFGG